MKSKSVDEDTSKGLTLRCANCGAPIKWSLTDLQYAKKGLAGGTTQLQPATMTARHW
jgi:hypothetical protein